MKRGQNPWYLAWYMNINSYTLCAIRCIYCGDLIQLRSRGIALSALAPGLLKTRSCLMTIQIFSLIFLRLLLCWILLRQAGLAWPITSRPILINQALHLSSSNIQVQNKGNRFLLLNGFMAKYFIRLADSDHRFRVSACGTRFDSWHALLAPSIFTPGYYSSFTLPPLSCCTTWPK